VLSSDKNRVNKILGVLVLCLSMFVVAVNTLLGATANVQYNANGFSPQTVNVTVGDTVTWINNSSEFLELASDPHPVHTLYPFLNVGVVNTNGGTKSLVAPQTGTFTYHNHLNSSHTGTLVISSGITSTPTITFAPSNTPTAVVTQQPTVTITISPIQSSTPTITPVQRQGDANGDGTVDGIDYVAWLSHYSQTTSRGNIDGDFNTDTRVDGVDYVIWLTNYGH
jgi:plastocyanin